MRTLFALTFAASLLFIGCKNTDPPAARMENVPPTAYPKVVALDGMQKLLAADREVVTKTESGAMSVSVPVRVLRDNDVRAQYRFIFLDDRGRALRPEADWQYKLLPGRSQAFLEGIALDPAAVDWRLEVRPNRD